MKDPLNPLQTAQSDFVTGYRHEISSLQVMSDLITQVLIVMSPAGKRIGKQKE